MEKKDFVEKYGFDLEDLKVGCIDNLMSKGFICYSIKELAYKIASDIYEALKVNNMVNVNFYYKLLLGGDFSDSDFKEVENDRLKTGILSRKSSVKKWLFNGVCGGLENYIKEILEA